MNHYVVTDAFGRSPDDDDPGNIAQRIRARRIANYGKSKHGKCWQCDAVGETYGLGYIRLCGDHRDAAERLVDESR